MWSHSACEEISFFAHLMKQSTMITAFDTYGHIIFHQTGSPETTTNWVTYSAVRWGDNKHWASSATVRPLRSLPIIIITIIQRDLVDTVIVAHRRKLSLLHDRRLLCMSHISVITRFIFNNPQFIIQINTMLSKVKDIHLIKNLIGLLDSQILSLSVLKIKYSTSIRIVRSERDRKIVFVFF